MTKLTSKQISNIMELYKTGNYTQKELAEKYGVTPDAIRYHLFNQKEYKRLKFREFYNKLSKSERKRLYEKNKEYNKRYMRERYNSDPEFREKHLERVKRSKRK